MPEHPRVGIRHVALDGAGSLLRLVSGRLPDNKIPVDEVVGGKPRRTSPREPRPVAQRLPKGQLLLAVALQLRPPGAERLVVVHKPLLDHSVHGSREKRLLGREDRKEGIALHSRRVGAG